MTIAEKLQTIAANTQRVYNAGIAAGQSMVTDEPIEKVLYRFGVLSDIHLKNDAYVVADDPNPDAILDATKSLSDYQRALTFYKNQGVDFLCINGDVVASSWTADTAVEGDAPGEWLSELELFRDYSKTYFKDLTGKPIYVTSGNHDCNIWGYNHGTLGLDQIVSGYDDGTKTAEDVWEEVVGSELRFYFIQEEDVFLFVPMYYWLYTKLFRKEDLNWMTERLEENKEKRVFLFFHPAISGTYDVDCDGIPADSTNYNTPEIKELIYKYPNVIWFTGHSHYNLWREGAIQPDGVTPYVNPNTYQSGDSMTMVHCPSCAYIRNKTAGGSTSRDNDGSQGLLVDVFADRVVVKGIDFTKGDGGAFIPKATYVINAKGKTEEA